MEVYINNDEKITYDIPLLDKNNIQFLTSTIGDTGTTVQVDTITRKLKVPQSKPKSLYYARPGWSGGTLDVVQPYITNSKDTSYPFAVVITDISVTPTNCSITTIKSTQTDVDKVISLGYDETITVAEQNNKIITGYTIDTVNPGEADFTVTWTIQYKYEDLKYQYRTKFTEVLTVTLKDIYYPVWIKDGIDGKPGLNGSPGANGTPGPRGSTGIQVNSSASSYSTNLSKSDLFQLVTGYTDKMLGDRITFIGAGVASEVNFRTTNNMDTWLKASLLVDGNAIVTGTLTADKLTTNFLESTTGLFKKITGQDDKQVTLTAHHGDANTTYNSTNYYGIWSNIKGKQSSGSTVGIIGSSMVDMTNATSGWTIGVYGTAQGTNTGSLKSIAILGYTYPTGTNCFAGYFDGKVYVKGVAQITGGVSTFTGIHKGYTTELPILGSVVEIINSEIIDINNGYYVCQRALKLSKKVFGIVSDYKFKPDKLDFCSKPVDTSQGMQEIHNDYFTEIEELHRDVIYEIDINSIGEGCILVCELNGNIEIGDLLVSSGFNGCGMKQDSEIVSSFTVGKSLENIDWSIDKNIVYIDNIKTKMILCVYYCG